MSFDIGLVFEVCPVELPCHTKPSETDSSSQVENQQDAKDKRNQCRLDPQCTDAS